MTILQRTRLVRRDVSAETSGRERSAHTLSGLGIGGDLPDRCAQIRDAETCIRAGACTQRGGALVAACVWLGERWSPPSAPRSWFLLARGESRARRGSRGCTPRWAAALRPRPPWPRPTAKRAWCWPNEDERRAVPGEAVRRSRSRYPGPAWRARALPKSDR